MCENALPGDAPSNWQVKEVGDTTIQGFATSMSVDVGETEHFKIDTPASAYHIEILRLGYYGGNGARLVASGITPTAKLPQSQPACLKEPSTGLIDCGNWGVSAQWSVPSNAVSGVYIALLTRNDTGGKSQIIFVVRNDASHSKILPQTSDATWEAYNAYGGNSLYTCTVACPPGEPKAYKGAYAVSYNRPDDGSLVTDGGASYLFYAEYQMIRFLEKNGYDVSYTSEDEVDQNGALLKNHKMFISSGHDEYWSAGQRASVEAAREAGVNLAFFSANEVFWKTRWGPSTEGSNTPYRTLTTYKETHFEGPVDPKDPPTWTGAWRDPRSPRADGGRPENALTGQQFEINSGTSDITVPSQYSKLRLWHNTAVANLQRGKRSRSRPELARLATSGMKTSITAFAPRASSTSPRPPSAACSRSPTTAPLSAKTALARTISRCTEQRAARWCSVPAPCSGPGGLKTKTPGRSNPPTRAERRPTPTWSSSPSTCSPKWARSPDRSRPVSSPRRSPPTRPRRPRRSPRRNPVKRSRTAAR